MIRFRSNSVRENLPRKIPALHVLDAETSTENFCSKNWERRSHLTVKERICYFSYFTGNISDEEFLSRHHESSRATGKLPPVKLRRVSGPIRPGCRCCFHYWSQRMTA